MVNQLTAQQAQQIRYQRDGVFYTPNSIAGDKKDPEPLYYVRTLIDANSTRVAVYSVDQETYRKSKGKTVRPEQQLIQTKTFKPGTTLSDSANAIISKRPTKSRYKVAPPLFVTYTKEGVSTWTGKEGEGFMEYTSDIVGHNGNLVSRGDITGVFILLSEVEWFSEPTLEYSSVVRAIGISPSQPWYNV